MNNSKHPQCNIGYVCTGLQCKSGFADKVAMRWITQRFERSDYTFADLEHSSNKFANILRSLGMSAGDVVFTFLPKMPEQFIAVLGALKLRLVTGTLFSNFGEEALLDRLGDAKARCVVTKKSLYRKIDRIRDKLENLKFVLLVDGEDDPSCGIFSLSTLLETASQNFETPPTSPDTPSLLHYTSGSTGKPKGVLHRHGSLEHLRRTAQEILCLDPEAVYWCTADQGWVTGTSYGIVGPWCLGVTQIHFGGGYDAATWFDLLEREKVTVWYTAPTALRMLMREDSGVYAGRDLCRLKYIFSVGEPLNPEVIHWARRTLDKDVYDTWFQTETGGIMIANRPGLEIRAGSMGKPVSGIKAAIIADDGTQLPEDKQGNLCVEAGWPSMFTTYLNNDTVYRQKFRNGYYFSGDVAYCDSDGYYWFQGRSDDVINTAGHLVSPFEIESALLEIEEVAESGVIGAPDDLLFEKVVAFVQLHKQYEWSVELELKLRLHVSNRVSSIATPQEIYQTEEIPKNKSGKIMRRVLKASYLRIDTGDTSTLEI